MNKAIATEEHLTSVILVIEKKNKFWFCKPTIFNLLVVISIVMKTKTKKKKEND